MWDQQAGPTAFSPFKADTDYFPADRQWMINLRVDGLDELLEQLRGKGVEVAKVEEMEGVGRFARIHDPEGNPIELWEPAEG
jgi:glyoxylase I family protein